MNESAKQMFVADDGYIYAANECPVCRTKQSLNVEGCGCVVWACGTSWTCSDYYHGAGTILADCIDGLEDDK